MSAVSWVASGSLDGLVSPSVRIRIEVCRVEEDPWFVGKMFPSPWYLLTGFRNILGSIGTTRTLLSPRRCIPRSRSNSTGALPRNLPRGGLISHPAVPGLGTEEGSERLSL